MQRLSHGKLHRTLVSYAAKPLFRLVFRLGTIFLFFFAFLAAIILLHFTTIQFNLISDDIYRIIDYAPFDILELRFESQPFSRRITNLTDVKYELVCHFLSSFYYHFVPYLDVLFVNNIFSGLYSVSVYRKR